MSKPKKYSKNSVGASVTASLLTGLAALTTTPAGAQDAKERAVELEMVVVTGSRIRRSDLMASSPVTVVGQDQIRDSGNVTIENTLYELPQLAAGNTSQVNANGGSGVLSANLRALGPTRTLVLVNGRRYISANQDGIVDLASIPDALVERVEVITGGASAVYGSDAIAGAINFILKDDFDGLDASYVYGETGESDGQSQKFDLTVGTNFANARGNVVIYGSYTQRDPVSFANRAFSRTALGESAAGFTPLGSSNIPGTRVNLSPSQLASLNGVNLAPPGSCGSLAGIRFGEGGTVLPFCRPEDLYNFGPDNYLVRPLEREQMSALASFDITPNVDVYSELHYVNTRNAFQQAPQSGGLETPGSPNGGVLVPAYATNPILSADVRRLFTDNPQLFDPDGDGTAEVISTGRRGTETGPRHYDYERDALNMTGGLRGQFVMLAGNWNWDTFFQYQRSRTDEQTDGIYSLTRVGLGLDVVVDPLTNQVTCRTQVLGCVPVNPFGIGAITPEASNFIATQRTSKEIFERRVAGASIAGDVFQLPAGAVAVALGLEHRKDQYEFVPGATDLAGEYGEDSRGPIAGGYDVTEYFGEIRVPILADKPFFDLLVLEAAARRADYSTFGEATTWKVGLEWAPIKWLRFRSAYNRALRAPTLGELFSPVTQGFTSGLDACDISSNPTQQQQALCVQQGVPQADIATFQQINVGFGVESGGNPDLTEEESETLTVGVVVNLPFVENFNVAIDYFDITVDRAIETIDAQQTVDACFTLLDNNSEPCQAIHRFAGNGQIDFVRTSLSNIGSLKVDGVDLQADYTLPLPGALSIAGHDAQLSFAAAASWLFERKTQIVGFAPRDCAGFIGGGCTGQTAYGVPDFKASLSAAWASGPVSLRAQVRWIGAMSLYPGQASIVSGVDAVTYVDLTGGIRFAGEHLEVYGGVDNVFDKQPPVLGFDLGGDANTDVSIYDVIGRRYFLGVRARF